MNKDMKFRLNTLLLAFLIGTIAGMAVGGYLMKNVEGGLYNAVIVVCIAALLSMGYIFRRLEDA